MITRGEGVLSVKMTCDPDQDTKNNISWVGGHVSPNASLWAGYDSNNRVIVMQEGLWGFKDFCFTLRP